MILTLFAATEPWPSVIETITTRSVASGLAYGHERQDQAESELHSPETEQNMRIQRKYPARFDTCADPIFLHPGDLTNTVNGDRFSAQSQCCPFTPSLKQVGALPSEVGHHETRPRWSCFKRGHNKLPGASKHRKNSRTVVCLATTRGTGTRTKCSADVLSFPPAPA